MKKIGDRRNPDATDIRTRHLGLITPERKRGWCRFDTQAEKVLVGW
jgi:hypothetical protein